MQYRKKRQISELKANEQVSDVFVVRFKKPVERTKAGKYYFTLKIQDAFGDMMLKYWGSDNQGEVEEVFGSIRGDDVIFAEGIVSEYNGKLDLSVNDGKLRALKPGEYEIRDFIRTSEKDPEGMFAELRAHVESVQGPELRRILDAFFNDDDFVEKFKKSPAAMQKHHNWVSGLMEHTLNIINICLDIAKYHKLDKGLLITGAILHDIGKLEEFQTTTQIKVTEKGNLLGHITIGVQMLTRKLDTLDISEETKNKVIHMLISHHGKLEYGSPKLPGFPEALVLAKVDELDAFAAQMIDRMENAATEDSFVYDRDFGVNIYLK